MVPARLDFTVFIELAVAFVPLIVLLAAIHFDQKQRKKSEKPPQSEKLLRPPGHSLSLLFDEIVERMVSDILKAVFLSSTCGLLGLLIWRSLAAHAPAWWFVVCGLVLIMFIAACAIATYRVFNNFRKVRNIRLGLRGEQAVAEALAEAGLFGFRSFHDLCNEKIGNIDHVAVGTRGVFLIETKARRRRPSRNGQLEHQVIYDGKFLQFPYGRDPRPIDQAKVSAKWLSNFLQKKTGEAVWVEPIVVLPGWLVDYSEKTEFPVKVMNATYLIGHLNRQTEKIDRAQVQRIITALDEKCRTVEF